MDEANEERPAVLMGHSLELGVAVVAAIVGGRAVRVSGEETERARERGIRQPRVAWRRPAWYL
jgi:hypothetical protein